MAPPGIGLLPQAGLPTHIQTSAPATADEDAQVAINLWGTPEQGLSQQDKDGGDGIKTALASNQVPGRSGSSLSRTSPDAGEGSEERCAPPGGSVNPASEEPEVLDTPDGSLWFFQAPESLGMDGARPEVLGPIGNLTALFLQDLKSIPRSLEQMMEAVEADGLSASSWLLVGLAAVAACEVACRRFREDSSPDALGEPAGGPALV
jgi:hypothetical protein